MKWDNLPDFMQTEEVEEYYNILKQKRGSLVAKRVFDIVMSLILLVVLSPFMLIIAIAVKGDFSSDPCDNLWKALSDL